MTLQPPSTRPALILLATLAVALVPGILGPHARAGGFLETSDVTAAEPSPRPGDLVGRPVPERRDVRCLPTPYRMNDTIDPIPNPLGEDFLTVAAAAAGIEEAMDAWNRIPTSFADLELVGTTSNPGLRRFDTVNEVTFRSSLSGFLFGFSRSVTLIEDSVLEDGMDLDRDGDPDVSAALIVCGDADGDGDVELPAGFYEAGTILDNDVEFHARPTSGFRFTVDPEAADTDFFSVDLVAVAVHEFGHSLGLAHVPENQRSADDATGSVMFPFLDTRDPASQLAERAVDPDSAATVSLHYPEGTADSGPPALGPEDVAFDAVYGLIEGDILHGATGLPVAGAVVTASDWVTGEAVSSAISGTVRVSFDPETGRSVVFRDPDFHLVDGRYRIPVPRGTYRLRIEGLDGDPISAFGSNTTSFVGGFLRVTRFQEEHFDADHEAAFERTPDSATAIPAVPGASVRGADLVTNVNATLEPFGRFDNFARLRDDPGTYFAVRFPGEELAAALADGLLLQAGLFRTAVIDSSTPVLFSEAALVPGTVRPDGTADLELDRPLRREAPFLAQENDFSPFYFDRPHELAPRVARGLETGEIEDLFLVLRLPTEAPFPGVHALPPFISLDGNFDGGPNDVPIFGRSFHSPDGETFVPEETFNYMVALMLGEAP